MHVYNTHFENRMPDSSAIEYVVEKLATTDTQAR